MRTILHIGMPKTGSTALQNCLLASRGRLAARGVLYPANPPGCAFNNHRLLILGFTAFEKLPRHMRKYPEYGKADLGAKYAEFLDHLGRQIAETRPECTILSSETLFRPLAPAARRSLRAALAPLGDPPVVAVYLRRPSEYYLSALQQRLKQAHRVIPPRVQSFVRVLRDYAETFGGDALRPRVFDRRLLAEGDVVADFLGAHLADFAIDAGRLRRRTTANETVSAEAMDLLRRFRLAFHPDADNVATPDSARLLHALQRADRAVGAQRPRLRPEIAEMIDYARSDPLRLRDAHGLVFPDLDYRRLERRAPTRGAWPLLRALWRPWRLAEIVAIDAAVQRAILADLARSRWAMQDPARGRWVDGLLRDPGA